MPRTYKQRRFVELYDGNGVDACRKAGYKGTNHTLEQVAYENLRLLQQLKPEKIGKLILVLKLVKNGKY